MTNQNDETKLIASEPMTESGSDFERALASLMLSIRAGQSIQMMRVPHSSHHKPATYERAAYLALQWIDPAGQPRRVVSVDSAARYWPENPPPDGPAITDRYSVFDKMLDAVNYHYDIQTFVDHAGDAVLIWDRASHGNTPAVILTPDNQVMTYYEAPTSVRQRVDRTQQVRYHHPAPA